MTIKDRAQYILKRLNQLYPNPPIPLDHSDAYTLLIAVLLSAQCTDKRVNLVTPALFRIGPTPEKMAKIPVEKIREIIRPCGLSPAKSKAISELSKILLRDFGAQVPDNLEDLESLPGVGHKTAQVIMAQIFQVPSFPVDTHIHRLAHRWGLSSGKNVLTTERDLKRIFPESSWNKLHLQMIYYGREHCTARGCDGTKCEICRAVNSAKRSRSTGLKSLTSRKPK